MVANEEKGEEEGDVLDVIGRQFARDPVVTEARVQYFRLHGVQVLSYLTAARLPAALVCGCDDCQLPLRRPIGGDG